MTQLPWHSDGDPYVRLVLDATGDLNAAGDDKADITHALIAFATGYCKLIGDAPALFVDRHTIEEILDILRDLQRQYITVERACPRAHRQHLEALLIANHVDYKLLDLDTALRVEAIYEHAGKLGWNTLQIMVKEMEERHKREEGIDSDTWLAQMAEETARAYLTPEMQERRAQIRAERGLDAPAETLEETA